MALAAFPAKVLFLTALGLVCCSRPGRVESVSEVKGDVGEPRAPRLAERTSQSTTPSDNPGSGSPSPPEAVLAIALPPSSPETHSRRVSTLANDPCAEEAPDMEVTLTELGGRKRFFSVDGYRARALRVSRSIDDAQLQHCVVIAWPPGTTNSDGAPCAVSTAVDAGWLRAIENTLHRVPFSHVRTLSRVVIDNRPKEHGIAAFDRERADDGRDGHTIWLHEHLFRAPNHWANGNHGAYWSYHVNEDDVTLDDKPPDHALFSPVLLHELGHLVMYNLVNSPATRLDTPECARTCADSGSCAALPPVVREAPCITPYCMPFEFRASTENWAEQYRFHYQSAITRALLTQARAGCAALLEGQDTTPGAAHVPPWMGGLPDIPTFKRSLWKSCGGRACKAW